MFRRIILLTVICLLPALVQAAEPAKKKAKKAAASDDRSLRRGLNSPDERHSFLGFRLVLPTVR
jgi:hypothetical protein